VADQNGVPAGEGFQGSTDSGVAGAAPLPTENQRISVGSGDEQVAKIQLAARWAEEHALDGSDSLEAVLQRFYRAYAYIDAVTHNVAPDEAFVDRR
jgi:hypothetical protein